MDTRNKEPLRKRCSFLAGVNNTVDSNVFAKATGHCLTFAPGPAVNGTAPPDSTYCPGYIWHPAYRGQMCEQHVERNIFLAYPSSTGGADAQHWHEPAEGICNVSARSLFLETARQMMWCSIARSFYRSRI
eukprot:COSAG06_NODE_3583_length_5152_cov_6.575896_5_plen_131_part_00